MTRLLTTTAAALILATGAYAQSDDSSSSSQDSGSMSSGESAGSDSGSSQSMDSSSASSGGMDSETPFAQVQPDPMTIYGSDLMGSQIYGTDQQVPETAGEGAEENWDQLGEISDIILTPEGQIEYAILGIGGFLGIGERNVAVDMSQINVVRAEQDDSTFYLLINATQEEIENAPEFQRQDDSSGSSDTSGGSSDTSGGSGESGGTSGSSN